MATRVCVCVGRGEACVRHLRLLDEEVSLLFLPVSAAHKEGHQLRLQSLKDTADI